MKVDVYSNMHNEEAILPYWLRHYETIADRIFVRDDESTDGTRAMLSRHPKVTILSIGKHNSDDAYWVTYLFPQYEHISRGLADWVIIADADEFVYHPAMHRILEKAKDQSIQVILCRGFSTVAESFPATSGPIYDEIKLGFPDRMESKWTIHSPDVQIRFAKGRHGPVHNHLAYARSRNTGIKLLHYRYLGENYFEQRDKKIYGRLNKEYSRQNPRTRPDGSKGSMLDWYAQHIGEATDVLGDI